LSAHTKKKILAVDDDPISLGALRQILLQKGYDVTTAPNAEVALPILESSAFDLFLLDVTLPGMSGYDLCRRIRKNPGTQDTPLIFLTAKGMFRDMVEGQDAGSDLYLIKPILATKLLSMVGLFLAAEVPLSRRRRPTAPTA
jgi:DNA-binding response OmpR family regulator